MLHIREEGLQLVEIAGLDGIKLVVVTLGAAHGAAEPRGGNGANPLGTVFRQILLILRATLAGHHVQPIVTGGDELLRRGIGQQIARQLLDGELVEALVPIEGIDHVVAVRKDALILIAMKSNGIGEPRNIQPPHGHALSVMRRS